jgi:hypothetical protein
MARKPSWKMMSLGCGFAVALAAVACGGSDSENRTDRERAANGSATAPESVVLVGCLQKGDERNEFILTEVNRQSPVGTSGSDSTKVQGEQAQAAAKAYRLSGDTDDLNTRVGKQIRVTGTIAERSNLPPAPDRDRTASDDKKDASRARDQKIDDEDLARVTVASIEPVAEACGGTSGR